MKLITDDKALQLSKMLLQNDKAIRDELLSQINSNHMEVKEQMSEVNVRFEEVDEKINTSTSPIDINDIEKIFNKEGI